MELSFRRIQRSALQDQWVDLEPWHLQMGQRKRAVYWAGDTITTSIRLKPNDKNENKRVAVIFNDRLVVPIYNAFDSMARNSLIRVNQLLNASGTRSASFMIFDSWSRYSCHLAFTSSGEAYLFANSMKSR